MHFSSPKKLKTFLVVVGTFTLNLQTSKQRGKNLAVDGGPDGGAPSHGTTGTMVNPALPTLVMPLPTGAAAEQLVCTQYARNLADEDCDFVILRSVRFSAAGQVSPWH